jgi:hypothetical protein
MSVAAALRAAEALEAKWAARSSVITTTAMDFMHGGEPTFARAFDRKGMRLWSTQRGPLEPWKAFRDRARGEAAKIPNARSLAIGGLPDGPLVIDAGDRRLSADPLPGAIVLPETAMHPSQVAAFELVRRHRRVVLACGRRWGKSTILITLAVEAALSGKRIGLFAPTRALMSPLMREIVIALRAVPGASINTVLGEIRLPNGGHVDFWSVDHSRRAGRGRKYHLALIDEAGHDEGYLTDAFPAAIAPTLLDYAGSVVEASTPNGVSPDNHFWQAAHLAELGFVVHHAPTAANPHLPAEEIVALRATMRPEIASQELDAEFVDMAGSTIFPLAALLIDGEPRPDDFACQAIGLTIDSNSGKGGPERDGCAGVIFGVTLPGFQRGSMEGATCVLLDWDIQSLTQGGVAPWLSMMRERTMDWHRRLRPLNGPPKAYVEPMGNAYSIIEAARVQGLHPVEIEAKYVSAGKDARALMVEPHSSGGRLKIGRSALDRRMLYRGVMRNHLVGQLTGFHAFDKDAYRREDDLLDAAMYSALVSLGDGTEARWSKLKRVA